MPHKHTRRKGDNDDSQYDLPPSSFARPLPVGKLAAKSSDNSNKRKRQKNANPKGGAKADAYGPDDTPKAFLRLMRYGSKPNQSGLDDGFVPGKKKKDSASTRKRKRGEDQPDAAATGNSATADGAAAGAAAAAAAEDPAEALKIRPHESLSDFSARVDRAMPIAGLARKGKDPGARMTKHEKHLRKLQAGWRADEARIREKEEEEKEDAEEAEEELKEKYGEEVLMKDIGKKGRGKKEEDPWAVLNKKREAKAGLNDVVQAPPRFDKLPKEKLKVKGGAGAVVGNVPATAGSLMRREQLGEERKNIIAKYREIMKEKRAAGTA